METFKWSAGDAKIPCTAALQRLASALQWEAAGGRGLQGGPEVAVGNRDTPKIPKKASLNMFKQGKWMNMDDMTNTRLETKMNATLNLDHFGEQTPSLLFGDRKYYLL